MSSVVVALLCTFRTSFRTRAALEAEVLALRHQLQVLERSRRRQLRLTRADCVLWVWLSRIWPGSRTTMVLVQPATGIAWTAQQLREAFPDNAAPPFLLHDRDGAFADIRPTMGGMGICQLRTAPRSPWQNGYAERVIGSIRRECLDHVIVLNEVGLRRILAQHRDVLPILSHPPRTGEGHSDLTARLRPRIDCRRPAGRRAASPVRPPRRIGRHARPSSAPRSTCHSMVCAVTTGDVRSEVVIRSE